MAESQVPYPYAETSFAALTASLSEQRFGTYLKKAGGDRDYAFALYLYNARLAKSLLFPLSVTEVALRNAVDAALVSAHGSDWHLTATLRGSVLTPESLASLDTAIRRANSIDRGKVIAELTFDFWSNLFRIDYSALWRTKANIVFPGLPHAEGRAQIQTLVKEINTVRNRVAHHEPILDVNIPDVLGKMIRLTTLRCSVTAGWMRHHTTASLVLRTRPTKAGSVSQTFASRSDSAFLKISTTDSLLVLCGPAAKSCCAFVCIDGGVVVGAFTPAQAMSFMAEKAAEADGLLDLNDHLVGMLTDMPAIKKSFYVINEGMALSNAIEVLLKPLIQVVVGVDSAGLPTGVIVRAHRRY